MELSLKDFLPFIGTVMTVFAGYMFLTVQVRKNRRAKWVEDFRRESGHLIWLIQDLSHCDEFYDDASEGFEKSDELIATAVLVQLYLDRRIKLHETFYKELTEISYFSLNYPVQKIPNLVHIAKLVEQILRDEQSKI